MQNQSEESNASPSESRRRGRKIIQWSRSNNNHSPMRYTQPFSSLQEGWRVLTVVETFRAPLKNCLCSQSKNTLIWRVCFLVNQEMQKIDLTMLNWNLCHVYPNKFSSGSLEIPLICFRDRHLYAPNQEGHHYSSSPIHFEGYCELWAPPWFVFRRTK